METIKSALSTVFIDLPRFLVTIESELALPYIMVLSAGIVTIGAFSLRGVLDYIKKYDI